MTKSNVERTLETVVDFQALHREQLEAMTARFEAALGSVTASIDALAVQVVQMNAGIKQNSQNIDKMSQSIERSLDRLFQAIDRQNESINGHLEVAKQQSANITELTKLVSIQAQTVNRLLEKLAA